MVSKVFLACCALAVGGVVLAVRVTPPDREIALELAQTPLVVETERGQTHLALVEPEPSSQVESRPVKTERVPQPRKQREVALWFPKNEPEPPAKRLIDIHGVIMSERREPFVLTDFEIDTRSATHWTQTDYNGAFRLDQLESGPMSLTIRIQRDNWFRFPWPTGTTYQEIVIPDSAYATARITGTIVCDAALPAPSEFEIVLGGPGGHSYHYFGVDDFSGTFDLGPLIPASYEVGLSVVGHADHWCDVKELAVGESHDLGIIQLRGGGQVVATWKSSAHVDHVSGLLVSLEDSAAYGFNLSEEEDRLVSYLVPTGAYRVALRGVSQCAERTVHVGLGQTTYVHVALEPSTCREWRVTPWPFETREEVIENATYCLEGPAGFDRSYLLWGTDGSNEFVAEGLTLGDWRFSFTTNDGLHGEIIESIESLDSVEEPSVVELR